MIAPTPAQQKIRDHPGLDLRIVAPAGCGKTEALALRVQGILNRGLVVAPRKVLVVTFSNRARDNIKRRLAGYLTASQFRDRVSVVNFHGLSARIFAAHAAVVGLDPAMSIPHGDWVDDQTKARGLWFNEAAKVKATLQRIKLQPLSDDEVLRRLSESGVAEAVAIEEQRIRENRLTYDDLPRLAELILNNEAVSNLYNQHFGAVIVDEFQDLTPQQLRIVNSIGFMRTTYAGDLAQGIYGFAGARPAEIDASIKAECSAEMVFNDSHRSSPAVLEALNALAPRTGGHLLTSAQPDSWPSRGLAGRVRFDNVRSEAAWTVSFVRSVMQRAPNQRVGIISRTASRRRFVDEALQQSDLQVYRWDDGVLDTDAANHMKAALSQLDSDAVLRNPSPLEYLRHAVGLEGVQEVNTREALMSATSWCLDLLIQGEHTSDIRKRIRVGDETTLLTAPGAHLLTGHVGKGQQFDWVWIVGTEQGVLPFFKSTTEAELAEEARVLAVMISRARHGAVITHTDVVPTLAGNSRRSEPSEFLGDLNKLCPTNMDQIKDWFRSADWDAIAKR